MCVYSIKSRFNVDTNGQSGQLSQNIWCFSNISNHSPFSTDWVGTWYLRSLSRIESFKFSFEEWLREIFRLKNIKITTSGRSERRKCLNRYIGRAELCQWLIQSWILVWDSSSSQDGTVLCWQDLLGIIYNKLFYNCILNDFSADSLETFHLVVDVMVMTQLFDVLC